DRGWLDQVSFYTNNTPPIIPVEPDPTVTAGQEGAVTLSVRVLGTGPVSYQWKRFGTNLAFGSRYSGTQSNTLTISPLKASDIGPYTLYASNAYGTVLSQPIMLMTFDQVLDTSALQWTYGGDAKWQGQTNVTHDGVDAAISGLIQDNQVSWIRASVVGPGTLSFWWKVDSEVGAPISGDGLGFHLDGAPQVYLSGPGKNWTNQVFSLTEGQHTLEWQYTKDAEINLGEDRGWLDQVTFIPEGPLPFTVLPVGFSGGAFQVNLQGEPGRVYRLYWSSNLLNWLPVQTNSDPSGLVPFTDPSAPGRARSFYRGETDAN
ncbi:MAG: immunoglobulin domain-containing protein, partial [Verrucomicrobia bacterium]|nr:immunoglobulin domain-containing protein [Verrucomicrobiota bacterium]